MFLLCLFYDKCYSEVLLPFAHFPHLSIIPGPVNSGLVWTCFSYCSSDFHHGAGKSDGFKWLSDKWGSAWCLSQSVWDHWIPFLLVSLWDNISTLINARYETRVVFSGKRKGISRSKETGTDAEQHKFLKDKENTSSGIFFHSPSFPPGSGCAHFANVTLS